MNISKSEKLQILLEIAKERYGQVEQRKNRAYQLITWIIGIFVILAGWIIQSKSITSISQKSFFCISVFLAYSFAAWFIRDLRQSTKREYLILSKIESLLGLYKPRFFDSSSNESLFPKIWEEKPGVGKFFDHIQILLLICTVLVIAIIVSANLLF